MTGLAAVASFPSAAEAFTQKQCALIEAAFDQHTEVNARHYSNEDKAEFRKFNAWLVDGGCLRNARLELVRRPEVGAVLSTIQTIVNRASDPSLRVSLSPTVSFVPVSDPQAVRPTPASPSRRDGAPVKNPGS